MASHTDSPDLEAAKAQIEAARTKVGALCAGERWTMRVPAEPGRDHDLVLDAALETGLALIAEVERLRELNAQQVRDLNQADASLALLRGQRQQALDRLHKAPKNAPTSDYMRLCNDVAALLGGQ